MTIGASVVLTAGGIGTAPLAVSASSPTNGSGHSLSATTRFYVPPPAQGSEQEILQLLRSGQLKNASLLATMESYPSAVWLTGETAAQAAEGTRGEQQANSDVAQQVSQALWGGRFQDAVPIFVVYNIPGRDCSQYSAGGAPSDAAYQAWINAISQALGNAEAVVLEEPDGLANLPGYCGSAYAAANPEITNTTRIDDISYAVSTLERDPNISLYLDAGNSAWQNTGGMAETVVAAGVQQAQGFFLNVSNYQYTTNSDYFGIWTSDCITYATVDLGATQASALADAAAFVGAPNTMSGDPFNNCPNQYWNGGPPDATAPATYIENLLGANNSGGWVGYGSLNPYGVWSDTSTNPALNTSGEDLRFAQDLGSTVPTTHFVVDTSRDGEGPNDMEAYAAAPYDQPSSVIGTLQSGNWCNPPGSGLGLRPTADTAGILAALDSYQTVPNVLDAYLWIKTSGQSDGQCDAAGGVRSWDDTAYTPPISGWPSSSSSTFDPLWSLQTGSVFTDPAAGAWFSQQALQLAQNASPPLPAGFPFHGLGVLNRDFH
jgi:endoglucanase